MSAGGAATGVAAIAFGLGLVLVLIGFGLYAVSRAQSCPPADLSPDHRGVPRRRL